MASEEEGKGARVCPIPRDALLEMVREEARVRKSDELQVTVAAEEAKGKTDGTDTITQAQVHLQQRAAGEFVVPARHPRQVPQTPCMAAGADDVYDALQLRQVGIRRSPLSRILSESSGVA